MRLYAEPSPHLLSPSRRVTLPLVWMPWQRQMMLPYLLPPELPETQLTELYEYALSFVERQDSDLVQTLLDLNMTIYLDYRYVSGSTNLSTTPFDVYCSRQGVCQDFANLMICLARLLGIPARDRVGYIYTGSHYANQIQSEPSHAWIELYLPRIGWQGFDPTNGAASWPRITCASPADAPTAMLPPPAVLSTRAARARRCRSRSGSRRSTPRIDLLDRRVGRPDDQARPTKRDRPGETLLTRPVFLGP